MTKFKTEESREQLDRTLEFIGRKVMTYRRGAEYLESMTGEKVSHEGLRKIMKNRDSQNGSKEERSEG